MSSTVPQRSAPAHAAPTRIWTPFHRHDPQVLVAAIERVAVSGDPGRHHFGVEIVVESPTLEVWERLFSRTSRPHDRDRAHIAVTDGSGRFGHPVHVRLFTTHGAAAVKHIRRRPGWATSNTAGQAILMMKARPGHDPAKLARGTVEALADLHWREPARGWRFRVDREVVRR